MPFSDDDNAFTYDSSDGYDYPSDFDDDPWSGVTLDDVALNDSSSSEEGPSRSAEVNPDLAAFRTRLYEEADFRSTIAASSKPLTAALLPQGAAARAVFSTSDLRDRIFDFLTGADLGSLSLINSWFSYVARARLLRAITLSTAAQARRLFLIIAKHPDLVDSVRHLTLILYPSGVSETLDEIPAVRQLFDAYRAGTVRVDEDFFWEKGAFGKAVTRPKWHGQYLQEKGRANKKGGRSVSDADLQRECENEAVLLTLSANARTAVRAELQQRLQHWPLASNPSSPGDGFRFSLEQVIASATSLTLDFPTSHALPQISTALSPTLSSLFLRGEGEPAIPVRGLLASITLPNLVLPLGGRGNGLRGVPSTVTALGLDTAILAVTQAEDAPASGETSWRLKELELKRVMAKRAEPPAVVELRVEDRKEQGPRRHYKRHWRADTFLSFDLGRFAGASSCLTSLHLDLVVGMAPSTIYSSISLAGPSLLHLHLQNVNFGGEPHRAGLAFNSGGGHEDDSPSGRGTASGTFHDFLRAPPSFALNHQLESLALSLPASACASALPWPLDPSQTWPTTTLPDALSRCTSLRYLHLRMGHGSHNSPYPPAVLDALLEAKPPLAELDWRVGVESKAQTGRALSAKEWAEFGEKVQSLEKWETFRPAESRVYVAH
ncbi:hypothetical protein JCM10213_006805 [Rhodosporidiobolus nylandii]